MTTRILPPAEWHKLAGTELAYLATLRDGPCRVVVVEDPDGTIVACWGLMTVVHAEGFWVAPDHRGKAGIMRTLLRQASAEAKAMGANVVWTCSMSEQVTRLLSHAGASQVPGAHFVMSVEQPVAAVADAVTV